MSKSLGSALKVILFSTAVCVVLTVAAAIATGEMLYLAAAALFFISGVASIYVVRSLKAKIGGK
jgi:hypothetical protein